ncbi:MAG: hypothetical protein FGM24_08610 [Candidatus Kapabacteria bacterium]|nr:hypothetical protein [Candidatus Kapabacteria bacterium]
MSALATRWSSLRAALTASGIMIVLSHAVGAVTWVASANASLRTFDLSTIQSVSDNPDGYIIPLFGMLLGVGLMGFVARGMRPRAPQAARMLFIAVALFVVNAVATYLLPDVWRIHAFLARVSFIMLIISQIGFFRHYAMRVDRYIAWGTLVAAVVLFVLPTYFSFDLVMHVAGVDVSVILGLCEVAYLGIMYTGMYRVIRTAEQETSRSPIVGQTT